MSGALRLLLVLSLAAVAIASLVLYVVRLGLGLAGGFDGSALLCCLAFFGAFCLAFVRAES